MGLLLGLDLGFGKSGGSAVAFYNPETKEFQCKDIPFIHNQGNWHDVINVCAFLESICQTHQIDLIVIEKNYGQYLNACEALNKALGAIFYCVHKMDIYNFVELSPTEVNKIVLGSCKPNREQRKLMFKNIFNKYMDGVVDVSEKHISQDQMDAFCMCLCACSIKKIDLILQ